MAAAEDLDLRFVVKKVKGFGQYADCSEEEQKKIARELTDPHQLFNRFSHLLDPVYEEIETALKDHKEDFTHSEEVLKAHQRAKHGLALVRHLPIKLFLSRLQQGSLPLGSITLTAKLFEQLLGFGALHAGIIVDNIRIEWGREGLIDPQWEDLDHINEDFVADIHLHGELARETAAYDKKISLADRERRVKDKTNLIIESAQQKRELITNLIEVIVKYNRTKSYSLSKCNCQHFVNEALKALGIKKMPIFGGQLNDYLQKLKNYQIYIPDQFKDHATLDAHVKQKLRADTLSQEDMVYLLNVYYRHHTNSMVEADGDEEWECKVATCQYEYLAEKVKNQSILCHQFLIPQGNSPEARGEQSPTHFLPSISEVEDCLATASDTMERCEVVSSPLKKQPSTPSSDHLQRDMDMARHLANGDQQAALEAHTKNGYYSRVAAKLRKMQSHADKPDSELHDLVEMLTNVEAFRANYDCFRDVVESPIQDLALDASLDKGLVDRAQLHHQVATEKVTERYESACKFPVKLVLCLKPSQRGIMPQGRIIESSLHEALLVSDHLFEWDESSLVIPRKTDLAKQPALTTGILYGSEWFTYVVHQRPKLEAVISSRPNRLHDQEIDLMFNLTTKKDDLMKSVIKTIIDYNRNKSYNHVKCNNRHFVCDVTKALGVKKLPAFGASLKQQLEKSKRQCTRTLARAELANHTDLDTYVCGLGEENLVKLTTVDLEYLVGKYFHCHVESWERSDDPDQWSCHVANCQLNNVEKQLERTALSSQSCVLL